MPGVDSSVLVHRLYVDPHYKPVKQKKRTFSEERGHSRGGYKVVEFMDAFRGYLQIFIDEDDMEKTAFVTEYGIYCW
ncbi:hypothetical protein LIER_41004 [Lithospermum erythrorhizon]|uniref:Uncharacterized protein n=1 Tax=Lithospermum erythrorhizon TaxID=34254 RepID=A0AAV3R5U3_LITER